MVKVPKRENRATPVSRGLSKYDSSMFIVKRGFVQFDCAYIEDVVGAMVSGNTEEYITVSYDNATNTLDFVVSVKDEDDMASDSDQHLPTQQSVKAYVDNTIAAMSVFQGFRFNPYKFRGYTTDRLSRMQVFNSKASRYIFLHDNQSFQYNTDDGELRVINVA